MDPGRACAACTPSLLVATLSLSAWRDFSPPPLHLIALGRLIIFVLVFFYISGFRFRFLYTPSASLSITHEDGTALVGFGHPSHDRDSASKKKNYKLLFVSLLASWITLDARRSTRTRTTLRIADKIPTATAACIEHHSPGYLSPAFFPVAVLGAPRPNYSRHTSLFATYRARAHSHTHARVSSHPRTHFHIFVLSYVRGRALLQRLRCLDERAAARR